MRFPNFNFESEKWSDGAALTAGGDEVGRGCFAGPVVASVVGFSSDIVIPPDIVINDSKKLTHNIRKISNNWIKENSLFWGIGECSVAKINNLGINKSTEISFRIAIKNSREMIGNNIDHLLLDAFTVPHIRGLPISRQTAIAKGDTKSISVAAASILAKVYRDELMVELSKKYPMYKWEKNKGYGTEEHRTAIIEFGTTKHHRIQFVKTFLSKINEHQKTKPFS